MSDPRKIGLDSGWDCTARRAVQSWMAGNRQTQDVLLDEYRDEIARELAEKIRAQRAPAEILAVLGYAAIWRRAVESTADLIDPDKE